METNMEIDTKIITHKENLCQMISEKDAIKSIQKLIWLTNNDASDTIMRQLQFKGESPFMFCYRMLLSARTSHNGEYRGIEMSAMHNILNGRKELEWAGTYTPNRRIQWEFRGEGTVYVYITTGTGRKSKFIEKVFDGVEVRACGRRPPIWLIPLEEINESAADTGE